VSRNGWEGRGGERYARVGNTTNTHLFGSTRHKDGILSGRSGTVKPQPGLTRIRRAANSEGGQGRQWTWEREQCDNHARAPGTRPPIWLCTFPCVARNCSCPENARGTPMTTTSANGAVSTNPRSHVCGHHQLASLKINALHSGRFESRSECERRDLWQAHEIIGRSF